MKINLALFTVLLFSNLTQASEAQCRSGHFTSYSESFRLATVISDSPFYKDYKGCPKNENCLRKYSSSVNDTVLVSKSFEKWSCIWNLTSEKLLVGWVESSNLRYSDQSEQNSDNIEMWFGEWASGKVGKLEVSQKDGEIEVLGSSIWYGNKPMSNTEGGVQGKLIISKDQKNGYVRSGNKDYDCQVDMKLVSDKYMIVTDNKKCGGTNVRFDGVFTKKNN